MAETKSTAAPRKAAAKPKTGKPPSNPAERASVSAGSRAAAKKDPAQSSGKNPDASQDKPTGKIKVTQLIGTIGRRHDQEATLKGLGLNKRHRSRVLEDTPAVRGMVYKVRHLVKLEKVG